MTTPDWVVHLDAMIGFASERAKKSRENSDLAKRSRYIRIGGEGFLPVSLDARNPCGGLYCVDKPTEQLSKTKEIESALELARTARDRDGLPGVRKTEHEVQAFLIRSALLDPAGFNRVVDCDDMFDELLFLTDEFRIGLTRADMILLAKKDGEYFPVFMELKAKRALSELKSQLLEISGKMKEVPEKFNDFLSAASGVAPGNINMERQALVLVWPRSESGNESKQVKVARTEGFFTVSYVCNEITAEYTFTHDK